MKKTMTLCLLICLASLSRASVSFLLNFRVPDAVKDVKFLYFELSNNGDTLFTEMNDQCAPGYVFSETAESRIRKGKLEMLIRYSRNGKKWKSEKVAIDITGREAEIHFYFQFGLDEDNHGKMAERTIYRIDRSKDNKSLGWKKTDDGKDSSISFTNSHDSSLYVIGKSEAAYGELFRRNESNLFTVEWKTINGDNPCKNQVSMFEVAKATTARISFPNLECNEVKIGTAGKYQARLYVALTPERKCEDQGAGVRVCVLDVTEYVLEFDKK